jgi:replicative DNA helicase
VGDLFTTGDDAAKGHFVVVAGPPKYGKTTFALGAPNPVFLLTDRGGLKSAPRSIKRVVPES